MREITEMGKCANKASRVCALLNETKKNEVLLAAADRLEQNCKDILAENAMDVFSAREKGVNEIMIDRLSLTKARVSAMADGLRQVAGLKDPVGELVSMERRPNGLEIINRRVPIGVIGIIYESRPNVTADAFGLCFKAGNAVILKGGSDAIRSNIVIGKVLREALTASGVTEDIIQVVEDVSRETTAKLMRLNEYVDVLIPRGGAGLIKAVKENSTVPVIETGTGICHIYVDESADFEMAANIIYNAKTQRIGVCNACESLVVHQDIREAFLPMLAEILGPKNVELRGDERIREILPDCTAAAEEDYGTEYLDYILSLKTVDSLEEAIEHVNRYSTRHSECIVTEDGEAAEKFLNEVDAACVYWNVSTRFTDGFEFGFGAEIGISTQKLHARGPMGLKELTSYKYTIQGNGQVRS